MIFFTLAYVGFWAWLVIIASSVLLITCLEFEAGGATIAVLAFGALGLWLVNFGLYAPTVYEALTWIGQHWLHVIYFFLFYGVAGAVWSVAKWFLYCHAQDDKYEANKVQYQKDWTDYQNGKKSSSVIYYRRVGGECVYPKTYAQYVEFAYDFPPDWKRNKGRLTSWIAYWPWSALWTMINDPFKRVVRFIYKSLGGIYSGISASIFAKHTELQQ